MKTKRTLLILFVAVCALGTFYLFNDEVFYREYRTQKKITEFKSQKPVILPSRPDSLIRHKFYHSNGIDFTLELNNLGYLSIKTNDWHVGSSNSKNLIFKVGKVKFKMLRQKFITNWSASKSHDADDHFGGIYYEVELVDLRNEENNLQVGFYNIVPDKPFKEFKDEIINLSENELKNGSE